VDKQQQLEGMCAELEAANAKGSSRQVFPDSQIIDSKVSATPAMYPASNWRKFD